jgi:hypothetical protein
MKIFCKTIVKCFQLQLEKGKVWKMREYYVSEGTKQYTGAGRLSLEKDEVFEFF